MTYPLRILHVIGIMDRGGTENMIMNLYRHIDRTKVQFDFVQNEGKEAAFDKEILSMGGRIYHCPRYRGKNHLNYIKWWKAFFYEHSAEYPIVHGHIGSTAAIYLSIAKKHGSYTIAHSHSAGGGSMLYSLFSYPTRFIADHFFACSQDAGLSRYGKHVANDHRRCEVLPNAIDVDRFIYSPQVRRNMRAELGIDDGCLVIGHVGRFVEAKNHAFLLKIFDRIHNQRPDAVLLLVGEGELKPQIEDQIRELHLEDAVILAGAHNNVYDYYQAMDVFVFPSHYEGLGMVAVEAQASGLPCYISNTVPQEAAVTDLAHFIPLNEDANEWAKVICNEPESPRTNRREDICNRGYDIHTTAKWLQGFYEKVAVNHGK